MSCKKIVTGRTAFCILLSILGFLSGCKTKTPGILPSVKFYQLDSTTEFNTASIPGGRPIVMFYFRPYCKHCKQETEDILINYKSFNDVQLVFISADDLDKVKVYAKYYNLKQYKNIQIAWDKDFNFQSSFNPKDIPYLAIYDRSRKLVRVFNGEAKLTEIVKAVKGA